MKRRGANGEIRVGVIGAGGRGYLSAEAHDPKRGSRIVAAADTREGILADYRKRYGDTVFVTTDWRRIVERADVDAVFVTVPDFMHETCAVAALEAGKAVYLEKPMAITIRGCDRILAAAHRRRAKLYVGHNMRHMAFVLKMKELIDRGAIGEVKAAWCRHFVGYGCDAYYKDWHAERRYATSLLLQKGSHDLDVMHWLCGGLTRRVTAMGGLVVYNTQGRRRKYSERGDASWHTENWPPAKQTGLNPRLDVEDLSMMLMEYDNGVMASYQQCHFTPDGWRNYTIIGTEGRIENVTESVVRLWDTRTYDNPYGDKQFFLHPSRGSHGGADPCIVREFLSYVRGECKASTCPVAARYSVAAGCQAAYSMRHGNKPMDVPPVPPAVVAYFKSECREGPFPQ